MIRNRLYVLDLGRMHMSRSVFFGDLVENDLSAQQIIEFPICAFLIDTPDGRILFDVGCHPDAMKPYGRWSDSFQESYPWSAGPDGEACQLPNRLEQLGIGPNDIKYVVLSHMHSDHAGCLEYFSKSQVIVHQNEYGAALDAYKRKDIDSSYAWKDIEQWTSQDMNWRFVNNDEQVLMLTDRVTVLNWGPGHAAGMLGLSVSLEEAGNIILASDSVFTMENYGPPARPQGFSVAPHNAVRTVERIRALADRLSAQVWCGHDMSQFMDLEKSTTGWYE